MGVAAEVGNEPAPATQVTAQAIGLHRVVASSEVMHPGVAAANAWKFLGNGLLKVTVAQPLAYTSNAPAATTLTAIRAGPARAIAVKRPIAAPPVRAIGRR